VVVDFVSEKKRKETFQLPIFCLTFLRKIVVHLFPLISKWKTIFFKKKWFSLLGMKVVGLCVDDDLCRAFGCGFRAGVLFDFLLVDDAV